MPGEIKQLQLNNSAVQQINEKFHPIYQLPKIAVIVVAHGEAETSGFFDNFSMTRHTLAHASQVMSISKLLQLFISLMSGLKNSARFRKINYVSPQNAFTRKQAAAVGRRLMLHPDKGDIAFEVFPAFSATPPFFEEVIDSTRCYDARVILYMAPVENSLNCGSICGYLEENHAGQELAGTKVIGRFWKDERLLDVYLDHIFQHVQSGSGSVAGGSALVLVFHGSLVADSRGNPPSFHTGVDETMAFAGLLSKAVMSDRRNKFGQISVSFLNHDVGGEWTEPSLEQTLEGLKKEAPQHVALFASGYFSDGNETCLKAKEALLKSGMESVTYIPCVNDSAAFIDYLSDRIVTAARQVVNLNNSPKG